MGDGRDTKFWEDSWIGSRPLKNDFVRIYRLDKEVEPKVFNRRELNSSVSWLRRTPRGGIEEEQWNSLVDLVDVFEFSPQIDRWRWLGDGSGDFSVAAARKIIDNKILIIDNMSTRWIKEVPGKVNIFVWRMLLNKLPTRDNLSARGFEIAKDVWNLIGRWWKLDIPFFGSIHQMFQWVDNIQLKNKVKKGLMAVVTTTTWSLWKFRNESIFGSVKPKKVHIFYSIVSQSYLWMSSRNVKLSCFLLGFICDPIKVLNSL